MKTQTKDNPQVKKTWQTPELVIYGDIEKITGEAQCAPGAPGGLSCS